MGDLNVRIRKSCSCRGDNSSFGGNEGVCVASKGAKRLGDIEGFNFSVCFLGGGWANYNRF